ncbi:DNA (cytosine-5-)-methyltransferase [Gottfriedia acidiceleris]|uniref:DNA (cytosine-5-)-methyltransferase n=1 Tax=Gottfriedia acidiceleris TaxID=371036 RepID=UPI003D1B1D36
MKKTVIELFAGVGGFHAGLKKAGDWDVVWANQWEPGKKVQHAYNCYVSHFPEVNAQNIDIAKVNLDPENFPIPQHNLLVGGFPCQDYSVASTGAKGIEGKKGVLWWEIRNILERHRPPFVLLENVDRLLKSPTKKRGRDFAVMLACFRDLGYSVEWRVINAADYEFAQRRRRVFIFAFHKDTNYHKEQEKYNLFEMNNYITENGFFSKEFPIAEIKESKQISLEKDIQTISDSYDKGFFEAGIMIGDQVVTEKFQPMEFKPQPLSEILVSDVGEEYYLGENLDKWKYLKGSKEQPRRTKEGFEYMFREGSIAFPDPINKPARTILTSESSKNRSTHVIEDPQTKRLRLLTPIECERLNGFESDWTNTGMPEKFRYFCMGNALVVGLIEKMGKTLNEIFANENENEELTNELSNRLKDEKIIQNAKVEANLIIQNALIEAERIIQDAIEKANKINKSVGVEIEENNHEDKSDKSFRKGVVKI